MIMTTISYRQGRHCDILPYDVIRRRSGLSILQIAIPSVTACTQAGNRRGMLAKCGYNMRFAGHKQTMTLIVYFEV